MSMKWRDYAIVLSLTLGMLALCSLGTAEAEKTRPQENSLKARAFATFGETPSSGAVDICVQHLGGTYQSCIHDIEVSSTLLQAYFTYRDRVLAAEAQAP